MPWIVFSGNWQRHSPAKDWPQPSNAGRDFVEAHLPESIGLDSLAAAAGLSIDHFSPAFQQSVGVLPHSYVLCRRVERAKEMSSMSGIAAALSPRERCILEL